MTAAINLGGVRVFMCFSVCVWCVCLCMCEWVNQRESVIDSVFVQYTCISFSVCVRERARAKNKDRLIKSCLTACLEILYVFTCLLCVCMCKQVGHIKKAIGNWIDCCSANKGGGHGQQLSYPQTSCHTKSLSILSLFSVSCCFSLVSQSHIHTRTHCPSLSSISSGFSLYISLSVCHRHPTLNTHTHTHTLYSTFHSRQLPIMKLLMVCHSFPLFA